MKKTAVGQRHEHHLQLAGRIRVRHPALRDPPTLEDVARRVQRTVGVRSVQGQALTGSVLVHYDREALTEREVTEGISRHLKDRRPAASGPDPGPGHAQRRAGRRWRNLTHVGMLTALGICTYAGLRGSKRVHIRAALVFLVLFAEHLIRNHKRLLR